jgi:hypothetical protein
MSRRRIIAVRQRISRLSLASRSFFEAETAFRPEADTLFLHHSCSVNEAVVLRTLAHPLVAAPLLAIRRYERHLSAASMVAGFGFDNYYLDRLDHPIAQLALLGYLLSAIAAIVLVHLIETVEPEGLFLKARPLLIMAAQFSFGGLWSAFLIFYGRSAVVAASWPFLIVLAAMLIGNEVFARYQARLAFTCTLLFFAMFSYAIFTVPAFTRQLDQRTFLLSGGVAIAGFCAVLTLLSAIGPERMRAAWRGIALGALGVFAIVNLFYFVNILPPLPLTLTKAGVFHSVTKTGDTYQVVAERNGWLSAAAGATSVFAAAPTMHVGPGESLSVYSAVFAPIQLRTNIVHVWQRYDEAARRWQTQAAVSFAITGGRDGGYRGYSVKSTPQAGRWRVEIATADGRLVGRVPFFVVPGGNGAAGVAQVLR